MKVAMFLGGMRIFAAWDDAKRKSDGIVSVTVTNGPQAPEHGR
jgi:hypothetical protein